MRLSRFVDALGPPIALALANNLLGPSLWLLFDLLVWRGHWWGNGFWLVTKATAAVWAGYRARARGGTLWAGIVAALVVTVIAEPLGWGGRLRLESWHAARQGAPVEPRFWELEVLEGLVRWLPVYAALGALGVWVALRRSGRAGVEYGGAPPEDLGTSGGHGGGGSGDATTVRPARRLFRTVLLAYILVGSVHGVVQGSAHFPPELRPYVTTPMRTPSEIGTVDFARAATDLIDLLGAVIGLVALVDLWRFRRSGRRLFVIATVLGSVALPRAGRFAVMAPWSVPLGALEGLAQGALIAMMFTEPVASEFDRQVPSLD